MKPQSAHDYNYYCCLHRHKKGEHKTISNSSSRLPAIRGGETYSYWSGVARLDFIAGSFWPQTESSSLTLWQQFAKYVAGNQQGSEKRTTTAQEGQTGPGTEDQVYKSHKQRRAQKYATKWQWLTLCGCLVWPIRMYECVCVFVPVWRLGLLCTILLTSFRSNRPCFVLGATSVFRFFVRLTFWQLIKEAKTKRDLRAVFAQM